MLIIENIKLALNAIRINKMRSFLTMLGIIIGISSVIAITAIGSSMQGVLDKQFASVGKSAMVTYPNWNMIDDYIPSDALFDRDDMNTLKAKFPEYIAYIDPNVSASSDYRIGRLDGKISMSGTAAGRDKMLNLNMIYGRYINEADVNGAKPRLVIEAKTAKKMFGTENAVGKTVDLTVEEELKEFTVVGVYKEEDSIFTAMNTSQNDFGYIPYSLMPGQADWTAYFYMYTAEGVNQTEAGEKITAYMAKMKGMPEGYYMYESAEAQANMMTSMLSTVSTAIGIIAGISLLVGGIGIMNIMLVSVTERTREIGIRKSLGARTGDILFQFLTESMIISAIGGLIGTTLGCGIAAVGMSAFGVDFIINPMVIVLAVGFSAVVGVFFGIYPARRAAKLDPIEALRFE